MDSVTGRDVSGLLPLLGPGLGGGTERVQGIVRAQVGGRHQEVGGGQVYTRQAGVTRSEGRASGYGGRDTGRWCG